MIIVKKTFIRQKQNIAEPFCGIVYSSVYIYMQIWSYVYVSHICFIYIYMYLHICIFISIYLYIYVHIYILMFRHSHGFQDSVAIHKTRRTLWRCLLRSIDAIDEAWPTEKKPWPKSFGDWIKSVNKYNDNYPYLNNYKYLYIMILPSGKLT